MAGRTGGRQDGRQGGRGDINMTQAELNALINDRVVEALAAFQAANQAGKFFCFISW